MKTAIKHYKINIKSLMNLFDSNGDNRLDFEEFQNLVNSIDK